MRKWRATSLKTYIDNKSKKKEKKPTWASWSLTSGAVGVYVHFLNVGSGDKTWEMLFKLSQVRHHYLPLLVVQ